MIVTNLSNATSATALQFDLAHRGTLQPGSVVVENGEFTSARHGHALRVLVQFVDIRRGPCPPRRLGATRWGPIEGSSA